MNLGNNTFSGPIPSEIGSLEKLEVMDLFDNGLTGSIPSEIGKLTNARVLYFEKNHVSQLNVSSIYYNSVKISSDPPLLVYSSRGSCPQKLEIWKLVQFCGFMKII